VIHATHKALSLRNKLTAKSRFFAGPVKPQEVLIFLVISFKTATEKWFLEKDF